MPCSGAILFDMHVDRIHRDADEVKALARSLASARLDVEAWDVFELKSSADALRHAADYLDDIRRRLDQQPKGTEHETI
jgi:hypothetical protein